MKAWAIDLGDAASEDRAGVCSESSLHYNEVTDL